MNIDFIKIIEYGYSPEVQDRLDSSWDREQCLAVEADLQASGLQLRQAQPQVSGQAHGHRDPAHRQHQRYPPCDSGQDGGHLG